MSEPERGAHRDSSKHHPVEVKLFESERRLQVTWEDDHVSNYPLRYFRGFCPCATCQGHRAGAPEFVPTRGEMIVDIEQVGNYGMVVVWDSGHNTGIYSFDYLRWLCPELRYGEGGVPAEYLD